MHQARIRKGSKYRRPSHSTSTDLSQPQKEAEEEDFHIEPLPWPLVDTKYGFGVLFEDMIQDDPNNDEE